MPILPPDIDLLADHAFERIRQYAPNVEITRLREAYEFAKNAHAGQLRRSGEPYIVHPLRTVEILSNFRVDEDTLIAAFLHDVPEDTKVSLTEIEERFGPKIAYLVDGITKLSKVYYRERMDERHVESLKKLFIHSAEDLRVILIKLADRLDNMRTLRFITNEKKRLRISRETLEVYVPIANLLGIGELRSELEDLCFKEIHPQEYARIKRQVAETMEERTFILDEMIRTTKKELEKHHMEAEIVGRPKTTWSIYQKSLDKQGIGNIEDLIAIRIIVPTRHDCYHALGIIHRLFKPKTGRIKDYIAVPKSNGYQSIHTTVFGLSGSVVEFQIRTRYMHLEAEYGIAAHYFYKYADEQELANAMHQRGSWVQKILEIEKEQKDPRHFMENLKLDVFQDRIFVFSPRGDVFDLPRGASAIDFAYAIHSDIGNHALKAEINGQISPVTATLGSGDTVRIISGREAEPEREWLNSAKTAIAVSRIKDHLHKIPLEKKISNGKKFLQREFDRIGKNFLEELTAKRIHILSQELPYRSLEDILIAVGEGGLDPEEILKILYRGKNRHVFFMESKDSIANPEFRTNVMLQILGKNDKNQFREILRILQSFNIPVVRYQTDRPFYLEHDRCNITVLVRNYGELSQIFESLEKIEGVSTITRLFVRRKISFLIGATLTAMLWVTHPFVINVLLKRSPYAAAFSSATIIGGICMLFLLVLSLKKLAERGFPELREMRFYWPFLYGVTTVALVTIVGEFMFLKLAFHPAVVLGLIVGVYGMLTVFYLRYKGEQFKH